MGSVKLHHQHLSCCDCPDIDSCACVQGLAIMVFVSDNEASLHAVNLAVALARAEMDTLHIVHACANEAVIPDAQKLMGRLTQGLGPKVNSEVTVKPCPRLVIFPPPKLYLLGT